MAGKSPFLTADSTRPAQGAVSVTLDAAAPTSRGLFIGTAGTISVVLADGTTFAPTSPLSEGVWPLQIQKVNTTGTSATDLWLLY